MPPRVEPSREHRPRDAEVHLARRARRESADVGARVLRVHMSRIETVYRMLKTPLLFSLALVASVSFSLEARAQTWDTLLDTVDSNASWSHMTAFDDGSVALVSRDYLPGYTGAGIFFRRMIN